MKRFSKTRPAALLLAICLLLGLAAPALAVPPTGLTATIDSPSLDMQVGESRVLTAAAMLAPAGATLPTDAQFKYLWEWAGESVFTMDGGTNAITHQSGQQTDPLTVAATAAGAGRILLTVVMVDAGGNELQRAPVVECPITVTAAGPSGVTLTMNKPALALKPGDTDTTLAAVLAVMPAGAILPPGATTSYSWISDMPSVATVTGGGNGGADATVSAIAPGSANITVNVAVEFPQAGGGVTRLTGTADCALTVRYADPTSVTVTPTQMEVEIGQAKSVAAVVSPSTASQAVVWTSSDNNVAVVEGNTGLITGVRPGIATITASAGTQHGTCAVTVKGMTLTPTSLSMRENETNTLVPMLHGLPNAVVVWTSSAPEVVRVTGGTLNALAIGTATITATVSGTSYSASCQVMVGSNMAGVITETADVSSPLSLSRVADRIDSECRRVLGAGLDYVTSLSSIPSQGVLFHGYVSPDRPGNGVGGMERYYYAKTNNERRLNDVTFVPDSGFGGVAILRYTAVGSTGRSFDGTIEVTISKVGDVTYSTSARQPITFKTEDFNAISMNRNGQALDYVSFVLPTEARGVLYYNYSGSISYDSKVNSGDRFYRSSSPNLSKVTFVPAADYTGSFTIAYTARDMGNNAYSGRVTINVAGGGGGDVTYTVNSGSSLRFVTSDFSALANKVTNGTLSYVTFTLPDSVKGTLYYNYRSASSYDHRVSGSNSYYRSGGSYSLGNVYFVPASGYAGTVTIDFVGRDTSGERFNGIISITVKERGVSGDVSYSTARNTPLRFSTEDFNTVSRAYAGYNLDWVRFTTTPTTSQGRLYYNYNSSNSYDHQVTTTYNYNRNISYFLSNVYFVPASGYTGDLSINFTAQDTNGGRFTGTISVQVGGGANTDVSYSTQRDTAVVFAADDFNRVCQNYNGKALSRVRFTLPSSSVGTLYYKFSGTNSYDHRVSESNSYYRSSSYYLDQVAFLPASGYTGSASIGYTGYDSSGASYTGTIVVRVSGTNTGAGGQVTFTTRGDEPIALTAEEFNVVSRNYSGYNLDYIQLGALPATSAGTLYYNYRSATSYDSAVTTSKNYYRSSTSPYLYNITFVPKAGYVGTVEVPFTGYDTNGGRFTSTLRIHVGGGVSGSAIAYATEKNKSIAFVLEDFNQVSRNHDGYNLDFVKFTTLPTSSKGTLYYNYRSAGSYDSAVSTSKSYYRSGDPALAGITFVPNATFVGTIELPFTAQDAGKGTFTGKVVIQVGNASFTGKVSYTTTTGRPVTFDADSFQNVSKAYDGYNLNYVRFTQPKSNQGTLYYNYREGNGTSDNKVSASTSYYRSSSPYLYNVTFVPASGYSGTVDIEYSGRDSNGGSYTGVVSVTVNQAVVQTIAYTSAGNAVSLKEGDFASVCRTLMGEDLARVRFAPPSASYGTLYYGYTSPTQYEGVVNATTEYGRERAPYLSKIAFVPARGYAGMVPITYTGVDANGNLYTGRLEITIAPTAITSTFNDMDGYSWAIPAVEYLYESGVVKGVGDGTRYGPNGMTTRGDFVLMLVRAFKFPAQGTNSFADVPATAYYASAIATAKVLGIVEGKDNQFQPTHPITRQDAMVMLTLAMRAGGRVVVDGGVNDLAVFPDGWTVSEAAKPSVGAMVRLGVVLGDGNGKLNPGSAITRAEMAVILYRALTL